MRIFILVWFLILLTGCGESFQEKGFETKEEAERLSGLGYPNFDALVVRGRFQNSDQARDAVAKGFFELSDYERDLYQQYRSETISLEAAMEVAADLTDIDLSSSLISQKISQLATKYPAEFDLKKGAMMGTAPPEICDLMGQAAEKIKHETARKAMEEFVVSTCNGVLTLAKRSQSLTSPEWVPTDNLPEAWRQLHNGAPKNGGPCDFGGFEGVVLFNFQNPKNNTRYDFLYTRTPPGLDFPNKSRLVITKHKVWVSSVNPNLFLAYRKNVRDFRIYLVRDDVAYGQHLALDGKPYDGFMLKFKETDYRRWSVDVSETDPYGDEKAGRVVCDETKYAHLLDHKWHKKDGRAIILSRTLRTLMK